MYDNTSAPNVVATDPTDAFSSAQSVYIHSSLLSITGRLKNSYIENVLRCLLRADCISAPCSSDCNPPIRTSFSLETRHCRLWHQDLHTLRVSTLEWMQFLTWEALVDSWRALAEGNVSHKNRGFNPVQPHISTKLKAVLFA